MGASTMAFDSALHVGIDLLSQEPEAAKGKEGHEGGHAVSEQRVPEDLAADVLELDLLHEAVAMMPWGPGGERAPALAPLTIMRSSGRG